MTPPPTSNRTSRLPSLTTALIAAFLLSWAGGLAAVRLYAKVFLEPTAKFVNKFGLTQRRDDATRTLEHQSEPG